jgi:tocopherol O-methyltransferase
MAQGNGLSNAEIAQYYDYMIDFYKFWFVKPSTSALHYGFTDENTQPFTDSLINTNRYLANKAEMVSTDEVLDAGCGIGGSAVWLAETVGCHVYGITISEEQVKRASILAKKRKVEDKTTSSRMDYTATSFPDKSFDVVWALESVCHTQDKKAFLSEAYRLLRPGGRLVIGDGYLLRTPATTLEKTYLRQFEEGFAIPPLIDHMTMRAQIKQTGFCDIHGWDTTRQVPLIIQEDVFYLPADFCYRQSARDISCYIVDSHEEQPCGNSSISLC